MTLEEARWKTDEEEALGRFGTLNVPWEEVRALVERVAHWRWDRHRSLPWPEERLSPDADFPRDSPPP